MTSNISRPASPAQIKFIGDLLAQIPAEASGVTDIPALLASLPTNPVFDTRKASAFIGALKTLKANTPVAATAGMPAGAKPNRYPGKCQDCKAQVPGGAGYFLRSSTGKVVVYHLPGQCQAQAAPAVQVECGLYVDAQGGPEVAVWRVYIGRQSGHRQASRLTVHGDHGAFEYVKGGTCMVDEGVANGTLRLITQDEAHAFGSLHDWCVNCGLVIEDDRSKAAGYGPVCATNNGWHYPTYQEAAQVLKRPVIKPSGVVVAPTCTTCGGDYIEDEACLAGSPDYRGEYPSHTH